MSNEGDFDFITEGVDVGIRVTDSPPLGLVARELFSVDFVVCASTSYLDTHGRRVHPGPKHRPHTRRAPK
ncbi:hypothetical protein DMX11_13060 [Pseudomonas sp. LB-090624]|uniref:hypothetical protein n=1 Tax=Pseudomonas sp. LB-090624 TaxID=2213079 RepID=UPI000D87AB67|nr:hypothetical protein DMX11_13060 [Pseudomonas sp. LB-090624]